MRECTPEEQTLITSYKRDFFAKTGNTLTIEVKSKWESLCDLQMSLSFDQIITLVCDSTGWNKEETLSKKRTEELAFRRQIIDLILYANNFSLTTIGKLSNRPNHTTVLHSLKMAKNHIDQDLIYNKVVRDIVAYIKENATYLTNMTLASPVEA